MLRVFLAGNLGRDAEFKTTQGNSEFCSFPVAAETGFGDRKATTWVDVTKWGKGAEGLARILRKGSKVAVAGEMTLREHNGKTYVQCRADDVSIMSTPKGRDDGIPDRQNPLNDPHPNRAEMAQGSYDDDSEIPF